MVHNLLRGGAFAAGFAAIGLASTLAACASTSTGTVGAGSGGSPTTVPTTIATPSVSASASPPAPASPSATVNPGGPIITSPVASPEAQSGNLPTGAKYVAIQGHTRSPDGRTIYLQIEARGGACGLYTVVVQESSSQVRVGMAQMPVKTGVMCPMYIAERSYPAHLSAPLGSRVVIDLATGRPAA